MALYVDNKTNFIRGLGSYAGRMLVVDHTLAFSRMTWTFLIPFLYFLGYPLPLVLAAFAGLYVCYLLLDFLYFLVALREAPSDYRKRVKKIWWVMFFLPIYRFVTYWFRLSGILISMSEPGNWKTENPVQQLREALRNTRSKWLKARA